MIHTAFIHVHKRVERGFTIVETLVAIAVILIAIVGPFLSIERSLVASYIARDELIGNSLAQEAVEYVQGIRDNDYLYGRLNPPASAYWLNGLDGSGPNGTGMNVNCFAGWCMVDPQGPANATAVRCLASGAPGSCKPLFLDPSTGLYNQQKVGIQTKFKRYILLCWMQTDGTCASSPRTNEAKLVVTVTWVTDQVPYTTTITEYLQNWL